MIRLGIIGIGNMGSGHARNVLSGACPDFTLAAIADINAERVAWIKENLTDKPAFFSDATQMLDSGLIDACIIAVPHYDHPRYAMECMKR
ncbi:MAG: Gfo/Idh/MocA family oxidoreductase, partial [Clostridia bacterium]|nr:Gfo/Idh/MocA family oxidoreductase [Clostridia bacterium]